jgi:hypothetical protein
VNQALKLALMKKIPRPSNPVLVLYVVLARCLLSEVRDLDESLRLVSATIEPGILTCQEWMTSLKILLFVFEILVSSASLNDTVTTLLVNIFDSLNAIGKSKLLYHRLADWKQGIWFLIHAAIRYTNDENSCMVGAKFIPLLEPISTTSEIIEPWRESLLEMIQNPATGEKTRVRIKSVLQLDVIVRK